MPIPGGSRATRKLSLVGRISIDKRAYDQQPSQFQDGRLPGSWPNTGLGEVIGEPSLQLEGWRENGNQSASGFLLTPQYSLRYTVFVQ